MSYMTPETHQIEASAIDIVRRSERPLHAAQILEGIPPDSRVPRAQLEPILAAASARGDLFAWPPYLTRSPRYWHRRAEDHIEIRLTGLLAAQPLGMRDIDKSLARDLGGYPVARRKAMIRAAIASLKSRGSLYEYPKLGRIEPKFSPKPADAGPYLTDIRKRFDALALKLQPAGVTREQIAAELAGVTPALSPSPAPAATPDLEQTILERLKGRAGGLSIRDLRGVLPSHPKELFDQAILSLYRSHRVYLDRHDRPTILTDSERAELVPDGAGGYYIGIAARGEGAQSVS